MHAVLILRGSGDCLVGDEVKSLGTRDLVTVPPMAWHQFRATKASRSASSAWSMPSATGRNCRAPTTGAPAPEPGHRGLSRRQAMTSNTTGPVLWSVDARGVATVTLNRPEVNNAYNGALIEGVLMALDALSGHNGLRAVVLKGNGKHFQAGADLKWINSVRTASPEKICASRARPRTRCSGSTLCRFRPSRWCRAAALAAARDHRGLRRRAGGRQRDVLDHRGALGLHASIIIPQLADAIGVRQLRRYALTGERFGAEEAVRIGLAHSVVPLAEIETEGTRIVDHLLANGPEAIAETKAWILRSAWSDLGEKDVGALVDSHAKKRQSAEAAEDSRRSPRSVRPRCKWADADAIHDRLAKKPPRETPMPHIEVRDVSLTYETPAGRRRGRAGRELRPRAIRIPLHRRPSGCGKSTLLNLSPGS